MFDAKKTAAFGSSLDNDTLVFIKDASALQERLENLTMRHIVFAISTGRCEKMTSFARSLPGGMSATVFTMVDQFNRNAVRTMIPKEKQGDVLALIDDDIARKTGKVSIIDAGNDGFSLGKSNAGKVAKRIILGEYNSEDEVVTAMSAIRQATQASEERQRNARFNEIRSIQGFRDRVVKGIAGQEPTDDADAERIAKHAFHVGQVLNSLLPAKEQKSEVDLKAAIAGALIANGVKVPEDYRKALPTVELPNAQATAPVAVENKPEETTAKRGNKAAAA